MNNICTNNFQFVSALRQSAYRFGDAEQSFAVKEKEKQKLVSQKMKQDGLTACVGF